MFVILWLGSDLGSLLFVVVVHFHQLWFVYYVYSAFVLPLFDYCDVVWCPTTAKLTSLIERVHLKFVNRYPYYFVPNFLFFDGTSQVSYFYSNFQVHSSKFSNLHNIFYFLKDITGHVS